MKKAKLSLGLAAVAATVIGLSGCNEVTAKEGVVLTFKAENGTSVPYTAKDLFGEYNNSTSAASTAFDKVYEVLIRHYYEADAQKSVKASINAEAQTDVNGILQQAENNRKSSGTTYEAELEKLLDSNGVDNVDELFNAKVYAREKAQFEKNFKDDAHIEAMRDGKDADGNITFPSIDDATKADDAGYLDEKLPYHVSHILVKLDADSSLTQGKISKDDAREISTILKALAGDTAGTRKSFGDIAFGNSAGDSTNASYGELGIVDKDTVTNEYVQEFGLGMYAYDAIYNKESNARRNALKKEMLPGDSATINSTATTASEYFENLGIGTIPYGAAIALANAAEIEDADGVSINDGNAVFYPRNVIFNKYFNKHNVAVIVPNEIAYNTQAGTNQTVIAAYNDMGTPNATYAALPGFSVNTKDLVDVSARNGGSNENVLTDTKGRIILAVRAGASGSYEGIHFIVINRSALDEFGSTFDGINAARELATESDTSANLSEYYTIKDSGKAGYPTDASGNALLTYSNFLKSDVTGGINRAKTVHDKIENYNDNINTYIFESLVASEKLQFNEKNGWVEELINRYIVSKRKSAQRNDEKNFNDKWVTYAEFLSYQDIQRNGGTSDTDGMGELISETCAIGYNSDDAKAGTGLWAKGGACGVK